MAEERRPHSDGRKSVDPPSKRKHNDRSGYGNDEKNVYDDRRQPAAAAGVAAAAPDEDRRVRVTEKRRPNSERRPAQKNIPAYDYDDYDYSSKKIREDDYDDGKVYGKRPAAHNKHSQPEIIPKVRSSSSTASIYNRPRSPPKINRPVPNNEKKKYDFHAPAKAAKATTTTAPASEDDFYDDYDYDSDKQQPEIKPEPIDSKKISFASGPSSQRDHRPAPQQQPQAAAPVAQPPPHQPSRVELKLEKLPPTPGYADEFEDEDFDARDRVTSAKPQRSTSPKVEHAQHHQRAKPDYYGKQRETSVKPSVRPSLDFNKDEYIPDDVAAEYPDEEIDDRITKDEEIQQPEMEPSRNEFRENAPAQHHHHHHHQQQHQQQHYQPKVPEVSSMPKVAKEQEAISYAQPQQPQSQLDVYKTKFHRLSPSVSVANPNSRHTDDQRAPNTEPEERDVYTILPKDTISTVREPSGFKPVGYEPSAHDTDFEAPKNTRPYVRIMKRPFLPSRGGSPYLPRGLKPVGAGITTAEYTTTEGYHNAAAKMPLSNVATGQYYTQNLPIARINPNNAYGQQQQQHPRGQLPLQLPSPQPNVGSITSSDVRTSTQPPQIESPRSPLDEIFNSDYDVTLNDALNPTLKPLSHHESPISHGFTLNKYDHANNPYSRADVSQSPSQYRTTAIPIPSSQSRHAPQIQSRHQPLQMPQQQQHQQQSQKQQPPQQSQSQYYDDEYDY